MQTAVRLLHGTNRTWRHVSNVPGFGTLETCRHVRLRSLWALALVALFGLGLCGPASAQNVRDFLRDGPKVREAFRPVVNHPSASAVRVRCGGKDVALGTIVGADGWIITKASVLTGKDIKCRFKDGSELPAHLTGVQEKYDLALLKVEAKELTPVQWRDATSADVGKWAASVGPQAEPVAVGIISVGPRRYKAGDQPSRIPNKNAGYLGVFLEEAEGGARVAVVAKGSPAEKGGLKAKDLVTHVAGKKILDTESMINAVGRHKPGESIEIRLKRGKEVMNLMVKLGRRPPNIATGNPQEKMGSQLSERRGGFPTILQHDTVLKPGDCGGPLVDLDGKTLGVNIARAGRTESYAIPAAAVRQLLPELMSGRLAPEKE
jgi:serine protease Do